jgi:hypothetical protein
VGEPLKRSVKRLLFARVRLMSKSQDNAWKLPDSRMPTERERQQLCRMLYYALLEIRGLGHNGKAEQAHD